MPRSSSLLRALRLSATVLPVLLAAGLAAPAPAAATGPAVRHCATVVSPTRTLGQACSDRSTADALSRIAAEPGQPVDRTLLLEEYKDIDYGGGILYSFYGDAGGCDGTGYHLVNYIDVALNVSSMKGYHDCNAVHLWSTLSVEKTMDLPAPQLGGNFNDSVRELQVFHR
ncbi:hypothetical protein OG500_08310 [Kitasatospora sp. NBC_01250]|uniref:hypothetical protein n=1 Tax=unclassified Kitasatospora TaxID=2633591 RepID=UPI002E108651|nr:MULTISPECIES: hypothetical protein [unclassified Kitasatospora]WSJ66099.1 hypothetical protein OG294_08230 [Kitasatospora sp. NBC_01302]